MSGDKELTTSLKAHIRYTERMETILAGLGSLFEGLKVVFFGVLMFSIIVTIHEAGHFAAARIFGLRVKEFMLGLPGPNIGFTFKGTKFGVTPILLGGYALIAGEGSAEENPNLAKAYKFLSEHGKLDEGRVRGFSETIGYDLEEALDILDAWGTIKRSKEKGRYVYFMLPEEAPAAVAKLGEARVVKDAQAHIDKERKLTFNSASWYKRVIILAAGVIFNLLFAIIVLTTFYAVNGTQVPTNTVETVSADSGAEGAGLQKGDTITNFAGTSVDSWESLSTAISAKEPGDEVSITFERDGTAQRVVLTLGDNNGAPLVGISPAYEKQPMTFGESLSTSVGYIGLVTSFIIKLFNPATMGEVISQSTSVVGVSFVAKDAAESGIVPFIMLSALLSISIGLMNLLPFPPLDGGKIVVETIERVSGRRIPVRIISVITLIALALLITLFIVLTMQDVQRFILGG